MARTLINLPQTIHADITFEVRVLLAHPMESGQRRDEAGAAVPRDIIHTFTCHCNGAMVFEATFYPAIAANPFLSFAVRAGQSGSLTLRWEDDHGVVQTQDVPFTVQP